MVGCCLVVLFVLVFGSVVFVMGLVFYCWLFCLIYVGLGWVWGWFLCGFYYVMLCWCVVFWVLFCYFRFVLLLV